MSQVAKTRKGLLMLFVQPHGRRLPPHTNSCHPERSASEQREGARVEGPCASAENAWSLDSPSPRKLGSRFARDDNHFRAYRRGRSAPFKAPHKFFLAHCSMRSTALS